MQSVGGTPRAGNRGPRPDLAYFRVRFQRQFFKTKTCSFWKVGYCSRGESCKFAHGIKELNGKPSLDYTVLCPQARRGQCGDPECRYAHDISDLRYTRTFYKTKICAFHLTGHCSHGPHCRFAHAESELRGVAGSSAHQSSNPHDEGMNSDGEMDEPVTWGVNTDDEIDELMAAQQWGRNATVPTGIAPERMSSSPHEGIPATPDSDSDIDEECDGLAPQDWSRAITLANPVDPKVMKGLHCFARGTATERISEEAEQDGFFATDQQWFRPGRSPGTAGPVDRAGALQAGSLGGPALGEHAPTEPTLRGAQASKPTELSAPQHWQRSTTGPTQLSHQQCGAWCKAPRDTDMPVQPQQHGDGSSGVKRQPQLDPNAVPWQHDADMPVQPQQHGDGSSGAKQQPQRLHDPPVPWQRSVTMSLQPQQQGDGSSGVKRQQQRLRDPPAQGRSTLLLEHALRG